MKNIYLVDTSNCTKESFNGLIKPTIDDIVILFTNDNTKMELLDKNTWPAIFGNTNIKQLHLITDTQNTFNIQIVNHLSLLINIDNQDTKYHISKRVYFI